MSVLFAYPYKCGDSVLINFLKGLGAPLGRVLVGDADMICLAKRTRNRLGGRIR